MATRHHARPLRADYGRGSALKVKNLSAIAARHSAVLRENLQGNGRKVCLRQSARNNPVTATGCARFPDSS
jgi:hypothetical protein